MVMTVLIMKMIVTIFSSNNKGKTKIITMQTTMTLVGKNDMYDDNFTNDARKKLKIKRITIMMTTALMIVTIRNNTINMKNFEPSRQD